MQHLYNKTPNFAQKTRRQENEMKQKYPLITCTFLLILLITACTQGGSRTKTDTQDYQSCAPGFSADSALSYVAAQCAFGPRVVETDVHAACANWIAEKFRSLGAQVILQDATSQLYDHREIHLRNIIASYQPQATTRVIVCAHWDSRPWADNDQNPEHHHTPIDGANDGGSGVAIMLELARLMQQQPTTVGIDFICFDAEDCGTPQWAEDENNDHSSTWCLGSQYWAQHHHLEGYVARYAILLDMVGGANTLFRKEGYSMHNAPAIVDKVWTAARLTGHSDLFVNEQMGAITDDHVQLLQSAIPAIDVIGSDRDGKGFCQTWHTVDDNLQHIDRETLRAVGETIAEVLWSEK